LNKQPWRPAKIFKKGLKHGIFFALAVFFTNVFVAYFIGIDQLKIVASGPIPDHAGSFMAMIVFSGAFYFVFAWFREQACTLVCPYGRLQSVLLDANSIVISYDFTRGEPRGKFTKTSLRDGLGDCIDCYQCVAVCPTGIDIRDGTQLECVNCAVCIDACDEVMAKVNTPARLIKYASHNDVKTGVRKIFTPRVIGYTVVLSALLCLLVALVALRKDVETTILRAPGTLFEEKPGGEISNLFTMNIINKTSRQIPVEIKLLQPAGTITIAGEMKPVPPGSKTRASLFVRIQKKTLFMTSTPIVIGIYSNGALLQEVQTTFLAPAK
jgi:cytochrome c oxidase accessory protein FixG